jgi:nitroreductase
VKDLLRQARPFAATTRNRIVRATKIVFSFWRLSHFYYFALSRAFSGEHGRVIKGIRLFLDMDRRRQNTYSLRRNIHRLEKGLVMQPRRRLFALDYVDETVANYRNLCIQGSVDDSGLLDWSHDVLAEFFRVTPADPATGSARASFEALPARTTKKKCAPYPRSESPGSDIAYDQLLTLAQRRRSVRAYQKRPVPRDLLDKAIQVGAQSSSACNRQPFEFRVFDDEALVRPIMRIPGGTLGWEESPPMVIVVVGHLRAFSEERDRHLIYIDSALALMPLMLALETLGLGSCIINFPDIAEKNAAMEKLLGLNEDEIVTMLLSVGYPDADGLIPFSQKKSLGALRSYNRTA